MKNSLLFRNHLRLACGTLVGLLAFFAVATFAGHDRRSPGCAPVQYSRMSNSVAAAEPVDADSPLSGERPEVELLTLGPGGFHPSRLAPAEGRFILTVNNLSGLEEVELRLAKAGGQHLRAMRFLKKKRNWSGELHLPPGEYVLTAAGRPAWACHISVSHR